MPLTQTTYRKPLSPYYPPSLSKPGPFSSQGPAEPFFSRAPRQAALDSLLRRSYRFGLVSLHKVYFQRFEAVSEPRLDVSRWFGLRMDVPGMVQ